VTPGGCVIEDVRVHHLRAPAADPTMFDGSYETTIVEVRTTTGESGFGEAESLPAAVRAIIDGPSAHAAARALREILVGSDPLDVAGIHRRMYAGTEVIGRRGLVIHAIGAVDIALWDLRGKLEGESVCARLGPPEHDRIPVYASAYPTPEDPGALREQLQRFRTDGFRSFKLCVEPWWLDDMARAATLVRLACAEAADDGVVIVDGALAYDGLDAAVRLAGMLRREGVWLFEAPLHLDDVAGHRALRGRGIKIGVGDLGLTHAAEWEDMLVRGHGDVLQPDPSLVGGITGMLAVCALADRFGCPVVPHAYKTRILLAANLQVVSARAGFVLAEYCVSASPLIRDVTLEQFPIGRDGCVGVPTAPGIGVTVSEDALREYRVTGAGV
jgi:L-rhamnonate dehydratase